MSDNARAYRGVLNLWLLGSFLVLLTVALPSVALGHADPADWFVVIVWALYIPLYGIHWRHARHCPNHEDNEYPGPIAWLRLLRDDLRFTARWVANTWQNIGGW